MKYKIVDTMINVELDGELKQIYEKFGSTEEIKELNISLVQYPECHYGVDVLDIHGMSHCLRQRKSILAVDEKWENSIIYGDTDFDNSTLIEMQLYSYLLSRGSLLIHSSLVDYDGNGIMFIGPSGIGKTTQAELWHQYQNADILNGDLVFVRKREDGFYGYGSPWHGSSPYYENKKVKLKALVMLEQGIENKIQKIDGFERLKRMMDQTFMPYWQNNLMDTAFQTIDQLLTEIPMYFLSCRPDEGSVRLVKEKLKL